MKDKDTAARGRRRRKVFCRATDKAGCRSLRARFDEGLPDVSKSIYYDVAC